MVGSWEINVNVNGMPQKVATAVSKLAETLIGAEYEPIAYLGSQVVNGTNHAVLAEQTILSGRDTKNIVVLTFNEKPNDMEATLISIERVVEGGMPMGGTHVEPVTDIPADAMKAFHDVLDGFVGSTIEPFALLATKVTKGTNYVFAAKITPVTLDPISKVALVIVNDMTKGISFIDLLNNNSVTKTVGYAFTW